MFGIVYNLPGLLFVVISTGVGMIVALMWNEDLGFPAGVLTASVLGCIALIAARPANKYPKFGLPLFVWGPLFALGAPVYKLILREPVVGSPTCFYLLLVAVGNVLLLAAMLAFSILTQKKTPAVEEDDDDANDDDADTPRPGSPTRE